MQIIHQEAADGNLGSDVGEDTDHAHHQVGMFPDAVACRADLVSTLGAGNMRQFEHGDDNCEHHERSRNDHVGHLDRRRLLDAVGLKLRRQHPGNFGRGLWRSGKNQHAADKRRDECSERVECLG